MLLEGLAYTAVLSVAAFALALVPGLLVALMRRSGSRTLSVLGFAYVQAFRSVSIYIYVIWIYFALPALLGIDLPPFAAGLIALVMLHSAYMAEIFRSSLEGVEPGQAEAARSLGLGRFSIFFDVVMPQGLRIAVPQLVSEFIGIIKDSSVVAVIGASDLMYRAIAAASVSFHSFEFYTAAGLLYLACAVCVSAAGNLVERRLTW